ncbi:MULTISPECIES: GTP-binding protein [Chelativorans]|uniref:Cobalamin synthesis protein, P47K n=1 Tax=Chelativorans sp. (strain BNC1) TaxID=266779 RepID=Q11DU5_CHESB
METARPIALVVVTGFLGAGKTTLLNRILKAPNLANTAVVINEFGDVSLDHLLIEQSGEEIVELGGGCLCCTVRGDFVDLLVSLPDRRPALDRVIVETTGLADPVPLLQSVMAHPLLSQLYRTECVITVIDAITGSATLDRHEEARRQAAVADRIVVTKAELAPEDDPDALFRKLSILNGNAELLDGRDTSVVEMLLRPAFGGQRTLAGEQCGHAHDHDHDHEHHHHHEDFQGIALRHAAALPRLVIENFLDLVASQQGDKILRIKGLVETVEHPDRPLLIQGAQQFFHAPELLSRWPDNERGTRLVIIGRGLDTDYTRRLFAAFTGQVAIDTPDRTAVEQNPLSIPGFRG